VSSKSQELSRFFALYIFILLNVEILNFSCVIKLNFSHSYYFVMIWCGSWDPVFGILFMLFKYLTLSLEVCLSHLGQIADFYVSVLDVGEV